MLSAEFSNRTGSLAARGVRDGGGVRAGPPRRPKVAGCSRSGRRLRVPRRLRGRALQRPGLQVDGPHRAADDEDNMVPTERPRARADTPAAAHHRTPQSAHPTAPSGCESPSRRQPSKITRDQGSALDPYPFEPRRPLEAQRLPAGPAMRLGRRLPLRQAVRLRLPRHTRESYRGNGEQELRGATWNNGTPGCSRRRTGSRRRGRTHAGSRRRRR